MLKKWIKKLVDEALDENLEERVKRLNQVTQALTNGDNGACPHMHWGKWIEKSRYTVSDDHQTAPNAPVKKNITGEIIVMERACSDCGLIGTKKIATNLQDNQGV